MIFHAFMTSGKQIDLILLDFSKTFDKGSHLKLLYKLQMHGVQSKTLGWIESFLVGRSQTVVLNGNSLDELQISSVVPQGGQSWVPSYSCSILMTYQTACSPKFVFFAEDTAVYLTAKGHVDSNKAPK